MPPIFQSPSESRIREFLASQAGPWSSMDLANLTIRPYGHAYLSTMFSIDGLAEPYLLILKQHDDAVVRARREFQTLSVINGSLAPRPILIDDTCTWFPDPVLVTTYVQPTRITTWDTSNLDRLARLMATIHSDRRLLKLDVDREKSGPYSVAAELAHEARHLPSYRESPVKTELLRALGALEARVPDWEEIFEDGALVYVHGDLPHHHVFWGEPEWKVIDWEWSRQSHPTRELARALWHLELSPELESVLLELYKQYAAYEIQPEALEVQLLLEYFYSAIHVTFWLDREVEFTHPDWNRAAGMCKVARAWVEAGNLPPQAKRRASQCM